MLGRMTEDYTLFTLNNTNSVGDPIFLGLDNNSNKNGHYNKKFSFMKFNECQTKQQSHFMTNT